MLPEPLHPAVVHFPIVLVVLLPLVAVGALVAMRRGVSKRWAWSAPLAVAVALAVSAWAAVATGEAEEDRVERVVSEAAMHEHEEAAERFLSLAGLMVLVAGAGMAGGAVGRVGRAAATVGAVGLVFAGVQVGEAGGDLVYEHGAANAYVEAAPGADGAGPRLAAERRGSRDDD